MDTYSDLDTIYLEHQQHFEEEANEMIEFVNKAVNARLEAKKSAQGEARSELFVSIESKYGVNVESLKVPHEASIVDKLLQKN